MDASKGFRRKVSADLSEFPEKPALASGLQDALLRQLSPSPGKARLVIILYILNGWGGVGRAVANRMPHMHGSFENLPAKTTGVFDQGVRFASPVKTSLFDIAQHYYFFPFGTVDVTEITTLSPSSAWIERSASLSPVVVEAFTCF